MDALAFLVRSGTLQPKPIYAAYGDEQFLQQQVKKAIRLLVLKADEDDFGLNTYDGDEAEFATVHDELDTLPFLGSRRLVIVEKADSFVSRFRPALEKYFGEPSKSGTLVLQVKSWPRTTRLAKMLAAEAAIECAAPAAYKLPDWCVQWASSQLGKTLTQPASRLLVDLIGSEMGQLDQELLKLAIYVGERSSIDVPDVDKLVGSSRAADVWKIFEAACTSRTGQALKILDDLFHQGQDPIRILGAFSLQLRRLAQAGRLSQRGMPIPRALEKAGVPVWAAREAEQQLRYLGQHRLDRLFDWLLELDLGLKGSSQLPPRLQFERLVVRLGANEELCLSQ